MATIIDDSLRVGQQKPLDDKYFNNLSPYTNTVQVNTLIPLSERHIGLLVNVNKELYWYKDGIANSNLIPLSIGGSGSMQDLQSVLTEGATANIDTPLFVNAERITFNSQTTLTLNSFGSTGRVYIGNGGLELTNGEFLAPNITWLNNIRPIEEYGGTLTNYIDLKNSNGNIYLSSQAGTIVDGGFTAYGPNNLYNGSTFYGFAGYNEEPTEYTDTSFITRQYLSDNAPNLQAVLLVGSSSSIETQLSISSNGFSISGGGGGQISTNPVTGITISGNSGGVTIQGNALGTNITARDAFYDNDYSSYFDANPRSIPDTGWVLGKIESFAPNLQQVMDVGSIAEISTNLTVGANAPISFISYSGTSTYGAEQETLIFSNSSTVNLVSVTGTIVKGYPASYDVDYSENYVDRSLVDKEYVDRRSLTIDLQGVLDNGSNAQIGGEFAITASQAAMEINQQLILSVASIGYIDMNTLTNNFTIATVDGLNLVGGLKNVVDYKTDFSSLYTDRSLVDRGYVSTNYAKLSGATFTGDVQLTLAPVNSSSAVNKAYVDNLISGISWKQEVRLATTANITLSGIGQTIDGVTVINNARILVKNQTNAIQNGIYIANSGTWVRSTDADTTDEITSATVLVRLGTVNKDTQWTNTNSNEPIIGTDNITFAQISAGGSYTNGTGLLLTGNIFSVDPNYISTGVQTALNAKQDNLVSGTNIRTVGGQSLVGSGNVTEVQNALTASTILAPSVSAVNTGLNLKADKAAGNNWTSSQVPGVTNTYDLGSNALTWQRGYFNIVRTNSIGTAGTGSNLIFLVSGTGGQGATMFNTTSNWRLGTGTADTGQKLQVEGTALFTGTVTIPNGVAGTDAINLSQLQSYVGVTGIKKGLYSATGTGAQTTFVFPHGLGATPTYFNVVPNSSGTPPAAYVTADSTNITFVVSVAPVNGSGNKWVWLAT